MVRNIKKYARTRHLHKTTGNSLREVTTVIGIREACA